MTFVRFILFCIECVNQFLDRNCPYMAGAISFYTLFSLFPLFLAIISVLGFILGPEAEQDQLASNLAKVLPVSSDYISQTVQGIVSARTITGIVSVFGLFWAATSAFGAIRKGINAAWGIKKTRPFLKERLIDFALVLAASLLILIVLFSSPTFTMLREITVRVLTPDTKHFTEILWNLIPNLLLPSLAFCAFVFLYRFLPNTDVNFTIVLPGAILASLSFTGANMVFSWYLKSFPFVYNLIYGSVGAIIALLTWVYVSAMILLFGALLTSRYSKYLDSLGEEKHNIRILLGGFSRVKIKMLSAKHDN